jgi:hypothetical protein
MILTICTGCSDIWRRIWGQGEEIADTGLVIIFPIFGFQK